MQVGATLRRPASHRWPRAAFRDGSGSLHAPRRCRRRPGRRAGQASRAASHPPSRAKRGQHARRLGAGHGGQGHQPPRLVVEGVEARARQAAHALWDGQTAPRQAPGGAARTPAHRACAARARSRPSGMGCHASCRGSPAASSAVGWRPSSVGQVRRGHLAREAVQGQRLADAAPAALFDHGSSAGGGAGSARSVATTSSPAPEPASKRSPARPVWRRRRRADRRARRQWGGRSRASQRHGRGRGAADHRSPR